MLMTTRGESEGREPVVDNEGCRTDDVWQRANERTKDGRCESKAKGAATHSVAHTAP